MAKEVYREAFGSLIQDSETEDLKNGDYGTVHLKGTYRILVDGNYETEFAAETIKEAIQKFKEHFRG